MSTFTITISASAVDSALTDEVIRVSTLSVGSTVNAAIFAADSGSGSDVWASSDEAGLSQIGLKLVYWSDADSEFAVDIAAASLSAVSDTVVYLQVGLNPGAVDPYPASAELSMPLIADFEDDTSNGNDGTGSGGITAGGVTGPDGVLPATDFDGGDDYVAIVMAAPTQYSLGGWYYQDVELGGEEDRGKPSLASFCESPGANTRDRSVNWISSTNTFRAYHYDGSYVEVNGVAVTPTTGAWYHVVADYDGISLRLYVNGDQDGILSAGNPFGNYSTPEFVVGRGFGVAGVSFLDGRASGQFVYSASRSAASINLEYLLTGPNAATYITAAEPATFNPTWAAQSNVLIGAAA